MNEKLEDEEIISDWEPLRERVENNLEIEKLEGRHLEPRGLAETHTRPPHLVSVNVLPSR